jgi:L-amino acid N-acyltransferase YncA
VLIAEDAEGVPVGFIFAIPNIHERSRRSLVIKTVVVRPDGFARGLGTLLAEKMHGIAREQGYDEVIHALMHEKNSSLNVLGERGSIHRSYRLFARSI